jgi:hypothetical protein
VRGPKRYLAVALFAAAAAAMTPGTGAEGAAPCPAGTEIPAIAARDFEAGSGGALTATHRVELDARFSDGLGRDNLHFSAPAGVTVKAQGPTGATLISDAPGAVPVTVSWSEFQSDGTECTSSTSTMLQLQAPTALQFGKLPRSLQPKLVRFHGKYYSSGYALTAAIGRYTDRRPVELRLRGIARTRLPSPAMPFKAVKVALRGSDPGFGNQRYLRGPRWLVTGHVNFAGTTFFLDSRVKTASTHDQPVGLELQVVQAGRLMLAVRQAGKCNFGGCVWRTMKVQRGT